MVGAKAEEMATLEEVKSVAQKSNANLRTMGVALAPCTVPAAGKPHFVLGEDEMEMGMGIHGEPGIARMSIKSADEVTDMLTQRILEDLPFEAGDEVAAMVNGLGATPLLELLIMFRKLSRILHDSKIEIHRSFVGNYSTSLDMAGASITLLRLNEELKHLLDAPASTPYFYQR
jgi:dihydroxyacetone kinase-like protein